MEFIKAKLQDIADSEKGSIISGPFGSNISSKFFVEKGIPVIRGNNLTLGEKKYVDDGYVFITQEKADELKCWAIENDLIFTAAGTIGQVGILVQPLRFDKYVISNKQIRVRLNNRKINNLYAYYWFSSPWIIKRLQNNNKGSTVPLLTLSEIKELPIFYPNNLSTQKKIADLLSCIDDKIALNNKTNTELENMAKTIFDYWFTQFDFPDKNGHPYKTSGGQMVYNETLKREIPAGWEVKRLNDFGEFKNGINYDPEEIGDTKVKIINVRNITESTVFFTPENFDELLLKAKDIQKYLTDDNDIFIARSGTPGATRLLPPDQKDTIFCGFIIRFKVFEKIKKNFLFFSIKQFENQTNTQAAGTILKNVSQDTLKDIYLFEPPAYVLQTFNSEISTIFNLQLKTKNENEELTKLRDYLLPLLMNGQIEVK